MLQGTGSEVGKSLLVAGLGRAGGVPFGVAKAAAGIRLRQRVQATVLPSKKLGL